MQMGLWTVLAAPLLMGNDLRDLSADAREILQNREVLTIADDPMGKQGLRVENSTVGLNIWRRELANGDLAVLLMNTLPAHANRLDPAQGAAYTLINNNGPHLRMSVAWTHLGWSPTELVVRDVFAHKNVSTQNAHHALPSAGSTNSPAFTANVPFSGSRFFRVSRRGGSPRP